MSQRRSVFTEYKEQIWTQLSEKIGGRFEHPELRDAKIIAQVGPWTLTLDTERVLAGYDHAVFTRIRAPFINPESFRFTVYESDVFSQLGSLVGLQDIQVGKPEFDARYTIKSNNPERVKQMLTHPGVQDSIQKLPTIYLTIKDDEGWFHETFPEGVDELYALLDGEITDLKALEEFYNLFASLLNFLTHTGSAYENDSGMPR